MRIKIIWVLILFLIASTVYAEAPITQVNIPEPIYSLTIVYPKLACIKQAENNTLSFDILDANFTRLTNETTNCTFASVTPQGALNTNGALYYNATLGYWTYILSDVATATASDYNYYVHCISANKQNGFISTDYQVTASGVCKDMQGSAMAAIILIPLLFGIMLLIAAATLDSEHHSVLKIGMMLLAFMSYFGSAWMSMQLVVKYFGFIELQDSISTMVWVFGVFMFVVISYFLIYTFVMAIQTAAQKKQERLRY